MAIALIYFLWRPAAFLPVTPYANDLHLAVNNNDLELVRSLLDSGYDPNSFTPAGRSILTEAVIRGNYQIVELLLSRGARLPGAGTAAGAPIQIKARPATPAAAHVPATASHAAPVAVAPVKAAAPAPKAAPAPAPAPVAAVRPPDPIPATGYTDSADGLIARQDGQIALAADPAHDLVAAIAGGPVPDQAAVPPAPPGPPVEPILPMVGLSDNPFLAAVETNRQEILKLLLMYDPMPAATFADGDSALMRAIRNEYDGIVELLLRGVDDLGYRNDLGQDALMVAAGQGYLLGVQQLLNRGAPIVGRDRRGDTALSLAVRGGYLEVARALLDAGAQAQNEISAAVSAYDRNMIQLLLDYDARLGLRDGQTLMRQAQALGDTDFAAYLARHGVRR